MDRKSTLDVPIPEGYRLVRTEQLRLLWKMAAGLSLQLLAAGAVLLPPDEDRIAAAVQVAAVWRDHADVFGDTAEPIVACLIDAASELDEASHR